MSADALPTSTTVARWSAWLGLLLTGLMLVLLVLIASWLLRACAPIDAAVNVSTLETPAPAAPPPAPDQTGLLKASLDDAEASGKTLNVELATLQDDLRKRTEQCKPVAPPPPLAADRWEKKDLGLLKGCWQLGRDALVAHHFAHGPTVRATAKAGQICFGDNGTGSHEQTMASMRRWDLGIARRLSPGELRRRRGCWSLQQPVEASARARHRPPGPPCESGLPTGERHDGDLPRARTRTARSTLEFRRSPEPTRR